MAKLYMSCSKTNTKLRLGATGWSAPRGSCLAISAHLQIEGRGPEGEFFMQRLRTPFAGSDSPPP